MYENVVKYLVRCRLWDNSEDGRTFQAKVYLLQSMGVSLENRFVWWHGHPVSDDLDIEEFDISIPVYLNENFYIKEDVKEKINMINNLSKYSPKNIKSHQWYEMLAGLMYIWKNKTLWSATDTTYRDIVAQEISSYSYDKTYCETGIEILVQQGLLPSSLDIGGKNGNKFSKSKRSRNRLLTFTNRRK